MFVTHKPERPVVIGLLGLQSVGLLGITFFAMDGGTTTMVVVGLLSTALVVASLGLYIVGFERARLASVLLLPILIGLYLPEPFVTRYAPLALMLVPAMTLVLASPMWVLGAAAIQLGLLLWRAGFAGVYVEPLSLGLYGLTIGSLVIARIVTDQARARAVEQSRLLEDERRNLELRVAERTRELELANQELVQASQLRDLFLANVSHELRTPLNVILGSVELLVEGIYGDLSGQQRKSLGTVAESGEHLLHLINDILDLAQMGSGRFAIEVEPVDVRELCEQCVRLMAPEAERKGLELSLSVGEDVRLIPGDYRRLRQVLLNLLSNAVKFTPAGAVGLEARLVEGGVVELAVWDTGIGISPEQQSQLFQPFTQLDKRLARQYEGTGLGLALVAQLAARHHGEVGVESAPGQGSRFWVRLPAGEGETVRGGEEERGGGGES